ncbi:hypothetical protein O3M35_009995 [Rhynocoris fuscipes]|uniref:Uncharacterized protein n=1 Tax=Rhynocoris fuscipes TaxID=488301 RepID=A0AAW1D0X9_9HEMI
MHIVSVIDASSSSSVASHFPQTHFLPAYSQSREILESVQKQASRDSVRVYRYKSSRGYNDSLIIDYYGMILSPKNLLHVSLKGRFIRI